MNSHLRTKIGRLTAVFAAVIGGSLVAAAIVLPASPAMASGTSCQYEEAQEGNTCVAVTSWHYDGDGDYTSYGKACVDVHS